MRKEKLTARGPPLIVKLMRDSEEVGVWFSWAIEGQKC
jgi:hypothetical protein